MWGELERYYFLKHWYEDCVGIVEYVAEWAGSRGTPEDVKKIGILATIIIVMLIGWKAGEFLRGPEKRP